VQRVCASRNVRATGGTTSKQADRIVVSTGGRQLFLGPEDVTHVEASGDYVRVHTNDASHLVRDTMARLTEAWSGHGFVRIHRGYSVRSDAVSEVCSSENGRFVRVGGGAEVPVSRRYARELTSRLTGEASPGTE